MKKGQVFSLATDYLQKIESARIEQSLSKTQLAKKAGLSLQTLLNILNQSSRNLVKIKKVSVALGLDFWKDICPKSLKESSL
jgi:DNA-binding XRE family transcriptional regulator